MSTTVSEETLVCKPNAIADQYREPHLALAAQLVFHTAQERVELADGYAFRFAADDYPALAAYVTNERLCCPFFRFELVVEPHQGPVWLRLCGTPEVKAYLAERLALETLQLNTGEQTHA